MQLATLDWIIIAAFMGLIVSIGLSYRKSAQKDLSSFFLGGRNLPWLIAGISMVATTFAADTPLAVADLTGNSGVSGNWLWWNFLLGGMLTTFFFARLWYRSGVLTEVELIELRYSGPAAAFLRGFKAVYLGIFLNVLIMGWVSQAMIDILHVFVGVSRVDAMFLTFGLMLFTAIYAAFAGLKGIAVTDSLQFILALGGCIILAVLAVRSPEVGGMESLVSSLPEGTLDFFPSFETAAPEGGSTVGNVLTISIGAFLARIGMQWWASWYPGAEPGGGGYVAQRMMSTRDEKSSVYAALFFHIAHYAIRPWPWIIVGLCALSLYSYDGAKTDPAQAVAIQEYLDAGGSISQLGLDTEAIAGLEAADIAGDNGEMEATQRQRLAQLSTAIQANPGWEDSQLGRSIRYEGSKQLGFVFAMTDFLPVGLAGLLLAAFLAAFMSTISTQLNWGASYLVNDLYLRFIDQGADTSKQILVSRLATFLLMVIGLLVAAGFSSITGIWVFMIECGAGLGLVLILRWYWWRINAQAELAATMGSIGWFAVAKIIGLPFPQSFLFIVGMTTVTWVIVMFMTKPTESDTLQKFYQRVRPMGNWTPIRAALGVSKSGTSLLVLGCAWILAVGFTYSFLFATGKLLFGELQTSGIYGLICLSCGTILVYLINRKGLFE